MTTYYVRSSGGSDGNSGLTFALGWATIQFAHDNTAAGDLILTCADGVHTLSTQVDLDSNAGTAFSPIRWRGASATGVDDGTQVTVRGDGSLSIMFADGAAQSMAYTWFEGFRFTNSTGTLFQYTANHEGLMFIHCRFDNSTFDGLQILSPNTVVYFVDCEIDNNGREGIRQNGAGQGLLYFVNCSIHDNTSHGVHQGHFGVFANCWVYSNGGDGVLWDGSSGLLTVINSVIDNNSGDGITQTSLDDQAKLYLVNNIISNNGGWGVTFDGDGIQGIRGNNLYYNNSLGEVTFDGISEDTLADFDSIGGSLIGNPLYADTGSGTEDYTIASDSPAFEIGYPRILMETTALPVSNFGHIGSNTPEGGSGGGGCIISG